MSDLSIPATELSSDPKASILAADNVGKGREGLSKGTIEQANDSSLGGSLTAVTTDQGHSTPISKMLPSTINATPDADLHLWDDEESEVWIPKGTHTRPNGTPSQPAKPARPPKN